MTSSGLLWHSTAADGLLQGGDSTVPTSVLFALPPSLGVCVAAPRRLSYKWDRWYLPSSLFKFGNLRMYIASFMPRAGSSLSFSTIVTLSPVYDLVFLDSMVREGWAPHFTLRLSFSVCEKCETPCRWIKKTWSWMRRICLCLMMWCLSLQIHPSPSRMKSSRTDYRRISHWRRGHYWHLMILWSY